MLTRVLLMILNNSISKVLHLDKKMSGMISWLPTHALLTVADI
jgi:hypothetical protein